MARLYVGNVDPRATERELEDEFRAYGVLRSVWVARKPPGFAFVDFDDPRDAQDAVRGMNGKQGWRVETARGAGGPRGRGEEMRCYECGETGHLARECRMRVGAGGAGTGVRRGRDSRSPPPRARRSPSYGRGSRSPPRVRRSPSYGRGRSVLLIFQAFSMVQEEGTARGEVLPRADAVSPLVGAEVHPHPLHAEAAAPAARRLLAELALHPTEVHRAAAAALLDRLQHLLCVC
eukprot:jgi/Mesen1/7900/ME000420S07052